ncbi:MAG: hypothetical protein ACREWI_13370, partial [Telluria sp.]
AELLDRLREIALQVQVVPLLPEQKGAQLGTGRLLGAGLMREGKRADQGRQTPCHPCQFSRVEPSPRIPIY